MELGCMVPLAEALTQAVGAQLGPVPAGAASHRAEGLPPQDTSDPLPLLQHP